MGYLRGAGAGKPQVFCDDEMESCRAVNTVFLVRIQVAEPTKIGSPRKGRAAQNIKKCNRSKCEVLHTAEPLTCYYKCMEYLIQCLSAPHTVNGNPRRVYVVYNLDGVIVSAHDDGFRGIRCVPDEILSSSMELPGIPVSVATYKEFLNG